MNGTSSGECGRGQARAAAEAAAEQARARASAAREAAVEDVRRRSKEVRETTVPAPRSLFELVLGGGQGVFAAFSF